MNKKVLIAIIGVAVLAVVGVFLLSRSNSLSLPGSENANQNQGQEQLSLFAQAFNGLGSVKCEYDSEMGQGTAYIKDGKVKFTTISESQSANIIMVDGFMYMWGVGSEDGVVIDTNQYQEDENEVLNYTSEEDVKAEIEANTPECVNENIDDAMFDPPIEVNFVDYNQFLQQIPQFVPQESQ